MYDTNSNGELDYKEFIGGLYENESVAPQNVKQETVETQMSQRAQGKQSIQPVLEKVREKLAGRGTRGIIAIGKAFRV